MNITVQEPFWRKGALLVLGSMLAFGLAACDRQNETAAPSPSRAEAPSSSSGATAQPAVPAIPQAKPGPASGADHSNPISPEHELSKEEENEKMPMPGQAHDDSSNGVARDPSDAERSSRP